MMAGGLSYEVTVSFCSWTAFVSRLDVAASNGLSVVTLSRDADAMEEANLERYKKTLVARALCVFVTYHSDHMARCADAYISFLGNTWICLHTSARKPCGTRACDWKLTFKPVHFIEALQLTLKH
jgi:hypothetical protein